MFETTQRFEPCLFEESVPTVLADLAVELQQAASNLGRGLHPESVAELADLIRIMNCYYSNLIEGQNTPPRDIERTMQGGERKVETRPLVLEARAHMVVQRQIDSMFRSGILASPTHPDFLAWIHHALYTEMPQERRVFVSPYGKIEEIVPGHYRSSMDHKVAVDHHRPPLLNHVADCMDHFHKRFHSAESSACGRILAIAAAHHRLNYIHPFPEGNGRVSRLMSHAIALRAGIGGQGLWSISRGLARGLEERGEYIWMMNMADSPHQDGRDGHDNLSLEALQSFTAWFMRVMLDQIQFAAQLFDAERLEARYCRLAIDITGDKRAPDLISAVFRHGRLERGDAAVVLKVSSVTASKTLNDLVRLGLLVSDSPKTSVRVAFPPDYREHLFPNLFADAPLD